jgi:hypothetical protein
MLRYDGATSTGTPIAGQLRASTSASNASAFPLPRPAGDWAVVITDYSNLTKTISIAVNQVSSFATDVMAAELAPAWFLPRNWLLDSRLRNFKVGDLYTLSDSLLRLDPGKIQLAELAAALNFFTRSFDSNRYRSARLARASLARRRLMIRISYCSHAVRLERSKLAISFPSCISRDNKVFQILTSEMDSSVSLHAFGEATNDCSFALCRVQG